MSDEVSSPEGEIASLETALRWRGIWAAIACISVVGFGLSLSTLLLSLMMEARGVSGTLIGLNTAVAGAASLAIAPAVTGMVRIVGTTRLIYLALAICVVFFCLFPFTPFWAWFPLRFVYTGSLTVLFIVSEFWINAIAPDTRRGFVMGVYGTVLSLGFAAGPTVLTFYSSTSPVPFVVTAVAFTLAAVPVALAGGIAPKVESQPSQRMLAILFVAPAAMLAAFVFGAAEQTMFAFLPLYGLRSGLEETNAALLVTMVGVGNLLFAMPIGFIADRVNRTLILAICGLAGLAGATILPAVIETVAAAYAVVFMWGGLAAGLYTVGLTQLGARFSGADLAGANALFVMLYSLGMFVGPAAAGAAMDLHADGMVMIIAMLFGVYASVAGTRWLRGR